MDSRSKIRDLMQTFQSGAAITKFGKGVSSNPTEGEENLTAEEWKVTLVNTLKYLKKIEYVKPVMKLSPPSPQEKRAFLASESFQDEGPIHLAVKAECDPTLRLLLKSGANPNAYALMPDGSKLSPLYFAVQCEDDGAVKLLLESGAQASKPAIVASDGAKKTPLAYARELEPTCKDSKKFKSILKQLKEAQSKKTNSANFSTSLSALEAPNSSSSSSSPAMASRRPPSPDPPSMRPPSRPAPAPPRPRSVAAAASSAVAAARSSSMQYPSLPSTSEAAAAAAAATAPQRPPPPALPARNKASSPPLVPVAVVVPSASADSMDLLSLKQRELEKALNLQEQLGLVEGRRADLAKRRRRKEEELRALEQEGRGMEEELNRIKRTPGYKDQNGIVALTNEITSLSTTGKSSSKKPAAPATTTTAATAAEEEEKEIAKSCPICFEIPKEIFDCPNCHNMTCGDCVGSLTECPMCRQDFKERPPTRNLLAERILNIT